MSATLFQRFLAEECTPHVRALVLTALEAARAGAGPRRKRFEFNLFEVTFDLDEGEVLIEDILNATKAGAQCIPMEEFSAALSNSQVSRS
jgi:hypothetical protein